MIDGAIERMINLDPAGYSAAGILQHFQSPYATERCIHIVENDFDKYSKADLLK